MGMPSSRGLPSAFSMDAICDVKKWRVVYNPHPITWVDPSVVVDLYKQQGFSVTPLEAQRIAHDIYWDSTRKASRWSRNRGPHPFRRRRHSRMAGK